MRRSALTIGPAGLLLVLLAGPAVAQPRPADPALTNPNLGCENVVAHNPNARPDGHNAGTPGAANFFAVGTAFGCVP